ncbi:bactofilin family protein [Wenzhouxiangella marina]|uniref:bactofilin family protein n=1 Tax=Wenzhouxiangella marina TaxID=1579979 RepID=UPI0006738AE4|nr:polymer-forming cytoskeletal protein [Wenzhouxiangella marina]MBB6086237.1 cytoskeletal protein CcmA (bactofilin family) [Wenzhouxiangella marina]
MGIISRGHPQDRKRGGGTTVIASGTKLVGDLTLNDSLHVDGSVEGKIDSDNEVSIGEEGRVEGDINADTVMISGQFDGSIEAKRLEIVATGRVSGSIAVAQLVIESGAVFNGTSRTRESEAPRRIAQAGGDESRTKPAKDAKADKAAAQGAS